MKNHLAIFAHNVTAAASFVIAAALVCALAIVGGSDD